MFKIGEFSKLAQVSVRMLRYYDEMNVLKPSQIDPDSGYRLYSADQIEHLQKILFLRDLGCGITEMKEFLNDWNQSKLEAKKLEIESLIAEEQRKLRRIENLILEIQENTSIRYDFSIKQMPSMQVLSLRKVIPNYFCEGDLWKELYTFVKEKNLDIPKNDFTFAIYHDEDFREENVDVEVCVAVEKAGQSEGAFTYRFTQECDHMLCAMVHGPFENISGAFKSLAGWLSNHFEYEMLSPSRQVVHRGPWNEESKELYLTEIQIPVRRK